MKKIFLYSLIILVCIFLLPDFVFAAKIGIETSVFSNKQWNLASFEALTSGISFSSSGTKMYVGGY